MSCCGWEELLRAEVGGRLRRLGCCGACCGGCPAGSQAPGALAFVAPGALIIARKEVTCVMK